MFALLGRYFPKCLRYRLFPAQEQRSQLLSRATGRVLEVGVGTGLNLRHYRRDLVSAIDAVDLSPGMLSQVWYAKTWLGGIMWVCLKFTGLLKVYVARCRSTSNRKRRDALACLWTTTFCFEAQDDAPHGIHV